MFGPILCWKLLYQFADCLYFTKIDVTFLFMLYFCDMELKMNLHCLDLGEQISMI